jgi:hypothetical protein
MLNPGPVSGQEMAGEARYDYELELMLSDGSDS